jgi:hypothetical protein
MAFKYNKLKGKIVEVFGSQADFSKRIKLSEQSITAKLAGRSRFSQDDIITWCEALDIDQNDIGLYFFTR